MRITILLLSFLISLALNGQQTKFSKIKISLEEKTITELGHLGIDTQCQHYSHSGKFVIGDFSVTEIDQIKAAGFSVEVLIEDSVQDFLDRNRDSNDSQGATFRSGQDCQTGIYDYTVPTNFQLGSMGGYLTYQEMLDNLDAMAAQYPNLISAREPIGPILTHEGRPIYWIRLSDNPNVDEPEPEVLYDGLHHAREPNSMVNLIYYMWHLLENYDSDPEIQYLVDNVEMYFVPCLNPDGYIYNETQSPNGGYLWRKNMRDNNGDGVFNENEDGVDLNRNYGFEWGFDNQGSSGNPGSNVYRGPAPFSEPETQNMRDFCNAHDFKLALNYHSYSDFIIYPFAYSDLLADPGYRDLGELLVADNSYKVGTGFETIGYAVNGDTDDWMFGEDVTKPAIYSMTPEVGPVNEGFWPVSQNIIEIVQGALHSNLTLAHLAQNYGLVTDKSLDILENLNGEIDFNFKRYGLADGSITVSLVGVSGEVTAVGAAQTFTLDDFENADGSFTYSLDPSIAYGTLIDFKFMIDNGLYTWETPIQKYYGFANPIADNGDLITDWESNGGFWLPDFSEFYSAPSSITDSPGTFYQSNANKRLTLNEPVNLVDADNAILRYWCKWDIENDHDYAQVMISTGGNYTPLCGKYTNIGNIDQDYHQPLYDGVQDEWVLEEIDLSDYLGQEIQIRFRLRSDNNTNRPGFYFDDFSIVVAAEEILNTYEFDESDFVLLQNKPNPADAFTVIDFKSNSLEYKKASLLIYNTLGQLVHDQQLSNSGTESIQVDTKDWEAGYYFYQLMIDGKRTPAKRISIVR